MKTEGKLLLAVIIAAAMAYGVDPEARAVAADGQVSVSTGRGAVLGASVQVEGVPAAGPGPEGR